MLCKYCGKNATLIDAHVIPAGFFRRLRDGGETPILLRNSNQAYPKRAPNGVYDPTILCAECEPRFGDWDAYAQAMLTDDGHNARVLEVGHRIVGYEIDEWRYDWLKLFFVSVAWRASVSSHPFFKAVRLGPYEATAKMLLDSREPGCPEQLPITLARFNDPPGRAIINPDVRRIEGINYIRFYLGRYVGCVKTDKRPVPPLLSSFVMAPGGPLRIIGREFGESAEFTLARQVSTRAHNRNVSRRGVRQADE